MKNTLMADSRRLAANDSYTFLMKELEKVDETILEPLSGTDWPRDMPVVTGGGLLESIAAIDVTYASSGGDDDNLFFDAANDIPVIQADMSKQVARTFNFAEYMAFSVMEREKMMQVGRDPETFLNKGIRLHCDKLIDRNVYTGFTKVTSTGLCNNPSVIRASAGKYRSVQPLTRSSTASFGIRPTLRLTSSPFLNTTCTCVGKPVSGSVLTDLTNSFISFISKSLAIDVTSTFKLRVVVPPPAVNV